MTIFLLRLMVTLRIIENFSFGLEVSLHWVGYYVIKYFKAVFIEEEEEEPLLIYTAQGSPFRRKKLSVINGSPEQQHTKTTLNI